MRWSNTFLPPPPWLMCGHDKLKRASASSSPPRAKVLSMIFSHRYWTAVLSDHTAQRSEWSRWTISASRNTMSPMLFTQSLSIAHSELVFVLSMCGAFLSVCLNAATTSNVSLSSPVEQPKRREVRPTRRHCFKSREMVAVPEVPEAPTRRNNCKNSAMPWSATNLEGHKNAWPSRTSNSRLIKNWETPVAAPAAEVAPRTRKRTLSATLYICATTHAGLPGAAAAHSAPVMTGPSWHSAGTTKCQVWRKKEKLSHVSRTMVRHSLSLCSGVHSGTSHRSRNALSAEVLCPRLNCACVHRSSFCRKASESNVARSLTRNWHT
mmetsp:Transcript_79281/g.242592  ORF Transcript_79281/g.242592 Transcript_79281/m.242592 type:complete len:322 (-) Transcript_79281:1220-2185(-)